MKSVRLYNQDCTKGMELLDDQSIDIILTDPPYKYLKNQKLEVDFDETLFFNQVKRVLKKGGFIVLFGRGASFYRWNYMLSELGFEFKEEIVWNKSHGSSPLMPITRVHETVSIYCNGKGKINKVKVPYLEMKGHDTDSIIQDIKRLKSILKNTKSLDAVLAFLDNNTIYENKEKPLSTTISGGIVRGTDRSASVLSIIKDGMNEKTIMTGFEKSITFTKHSATVNIDSAGDRDRCVKALNSMAQGMNEKSIIKQVRDHYTSIHPTQKPVRLVERLLELVLPLKNNKIVVCDPFTGSGSTCEGEENVSKKYPAIDFEFIGWELDKEYYDGAIARISKFAPEM